MSIGYAWRTSIVLTATVMFCETLAQAQPVITTVAGRGTSRSSDKTFCGDGGAARDACLGPFVEGVAVDEAGNLYIADEANNRIRKVDATGVIATAVEGQESPLSVAVDGSGNLFIAQRQRILKVDTNGAITTVAGGKTGFCGDGGPAVDACLNDVTDVAIDSLGNIFIADLSNRRVRKVDTAGIITTVAGNGTYAFCGDGGQATSACLQEIEGVTVDSAGNLFIADYVSNRVRRVDTAGVINTVAGNGTSGYCGDGEAAVNGCVGAPSDVAVNRDGDLFIGHGVRVRRVDNAGIISTYAGMGIHPGFSGDGGLATEARLGFVKTLALDHEGNLFVGTWNGHVRLVDRTAVTQFKHGGCAATGRISLGAPAPPGGLAVHLTTDNPNVTVPDILMIKEGKSTRSIPITVSKVAAPELVRMSASFNSTTRATAFTLVPVPIASLALAPKKVVGGQSVTGTVALLCSGGPTAVEVQLSSTRPSIANPTSPTITVLVGEKTATFTVTTATVTKPTAADIRAKMNGKMVSQTLQVIPF